MRRTKEAAEVTRESLIDAALTVFGRKGYSLTTLSDVAKEVGVTRGAIYWHFGGKEELYAALVQERFAQANAIFQQIVTSDLTPLEKLRELLIKTLQYVEEDEQYLAVLELTLSKTESTSGTEFMQQQRGVAVKAVSGALEHIFEDGKKQGQFKQDVDSKVTAYTALGIILGIISIWLIDRNAFSPREYATTIIETFLSGIVRGES